MPDSTIEIRKKETYTRAIENSVGSRIFNSLFVTFKDTGEVKDVLNNGEFSCAYFVSSILSLFQLMDRPHSTVATVMKLVSENKYWQAVDVNQIEAGDVVFWKKVTFEDGTQNAHVGVAISNDEAISTSDKAKMITKHTIMREKIELVYRYANFSI